MSELDKQMSAVSREFNRMRALLEKRWPAGTEILFYWTSQQSQPSTGVVVCCDIDPGCLRVRMTGTPRGSVKTVPYKQIVG